MTDKELRACPYYHLEQGLVRETLIWFYNTINDYESDENDFKSAEGNEDIEMLKHEFNKCLYIYCVLGKRDYIIHNRKKLYLKQYETAKTRH